MITSLRGRTAPRPQSGTNRSWWSFSRNKCRRRPPNRMTHNLTCAALLRKVWSIVTASPVIAHLQRYANKKRLEASENSQGVKLSETKRRSWCYPMAGLFFTVVRLDVLLMLLCTLRICCYLNNLLITDYAKSYWRKNNTPLFDNTRSALHLVSIKSIESGGLFTGVCTRLQSVWSMFPMFFFCFVPNSIYLDKEICVT